MDTRVVEKFLGGDAHGNVTGSCKLITINIGKQRSHILNEAGMVQTRFRKTNEENLKTIDRLRPINLPQISSIILGHTHNDHCGNIPTLVKYGFDGRIFTSKESAQMLPTIFLDSARILKQEMKYRVEKRNDKPQKDFDRSRCWGGNFDRKQRKAKASRIIIDPLCEPLYDAVHAEQAANLIKNGGFNYGEWVKIEKGVDLKFYGSGHVLGSAISVLRVPRQNGFTYHGYTSDLGRDDPLVLRAANKKIAETLSTLEMETTYGGRIHPPREAEMGRMIEMINRGVREKRTFIFGAFAQGRAPDLIFLLSLWMEQKLIPRIPIILDSPLATKLLETPRDYWHDPQSFFGQDRLTFNPFDPKENKYLTLVDGQEDSARIVRSPGPKVAVASSGMFTAGRVRNYLRDGLGNPNVTVCIVGYMAENTLGRKLKDGQKLVNMNKQELVVRAKIEVFDSFSAHADGPALISFVKSVKKTDDFKIIEVHGDETEGVNFKESLMRELGMRSDQIKIPLIGEEIVL
jgi:metallo-beta-lactamase family protein